MGNLDDDEIIYFITEQFKNWGLAKKVFAITTNNVNNNNNSIVISSRKIISRAMLRSYFEFNYERRV